MLVQTVQCSARVSVEVCAVLGFRMFERTGTGVPFEPGRGATAWGVISFRSSAFPLDLDYATVNAVLRYQNSV